MINDAKNKELWWQPAIMIFANVTGWIAGPIIFALIAGKYLDYKYGSTPWIFIVLTGLAFIVSIFGILKILTKYLKNMEKDKKDKDNEIIEV